MGSLSYSAVFSESPRRLPSYPPETPRVLGCIVFTPPCVRFPHKLFYNAVAPESSLIPSSSCAFSSRPGIVSRQRTNSPVPLVLEYIWHFRLRLAPPPHPMGSVSFITKTPKGLSFFLPPPGGIFLSFPLSWSRFQVTEVPCLTFPHFPAFSTVRLSVLFSFLTLFHYQTPVFSPLLPPLFLFFRLPYEQRCASERPTQTGDRTHSFSFRFCESSLFLPQFFLFFRRFSSPFQPSQSRKLLFGPPNL